MLTPRAFARIGLTTRRCSRTWVPGGERLSPESSHSGVFSAWSLVGASSPLTGPSGPLSGSFLPKTRQSAIKAIAVYEFMI